MKTNKFEYYKVIQSYHGGQWSDADHYLFNSTFTKELDNTSFKADLKEYRKMGYPVRVIRRRERI